MRALNATIRELSTNYFSPANGFVSADDIVEGQRYLTHLLGAAYEFYLEGDALRPQFVNMVSPVRKFLGDNPDARYHFSLIDGRRDYRIRGQRMGREYIAYTVHGGDAADGNWNVPGIAHINHRQISPSNRRGEYELYIGPTPQPGHNWLQIGREARYVICRHYYEHLHAAAADPAVRPKLSIEQLPAAAAPSDPLPDAEIARRLRAVIQFLRTSTVEMTRTVPAWWSQVPNQLGIVEHFGSDQKDIGLGALDNSYSAGPYLLAPGQVLIMTGRMPACFFANVVLWNRFLQTDDYRYRQISLNRRQMKLDSEGRYQIAIGPHNPDPARWDWLDTGDRAFGIIQWRFLLAEGTVETPRLQLSTIGALAQGTTWPPPDAAAAAPAQPATATDPAASP